jgi:hypothetical protein
MAVSSCALSYRDISPRLPQGPFASFSPCNAPPHPQLAGLIKTAWFSAPAQNGGARAQAREHVMPTGLMHLVFRLDGPAVRIFKDAADTTGAQLGHALVGGARAGFYAKDVAEPAHAIGMQLLPGAAQALLGLPADELAGRHVRLEDVWGSSAGLMREQLLAAPTPQGKLRTLEALLLRRLAGSSAHSAHESGHHARPAPAGRRHARGRGRGPAAATATGSSSGCFHKPWACRPSCTAACNDSRRRCS